MSGQDPGWDRSGRARGTANILRDTFSPRRRKGNLYIQKDLGPRGGEGAGAAAVPDAGQGAGGCGWVGRDRGRL